LIGDYHLGEKTAGFDYYQIIDQTNSGGVEGTQYYSPVFNVNGTIEDHPNNTHSTEAITTYT